MRFRLQIFAIAVILLSSQTLLSQGLFNGIPYQEFIGARPISMGETFVAIADDINAIYWNPAGLPSLDHLGVNSMRANLFNSGAHHNYIALAIPGFQKTSFGIDWMNVGFDDGEFDFGTIRSIFRLDTNYLTGYQF